MRHALEQMRRIGGFGEMLEDHVEKSHQEMDKFHQRVATLRNYEMRAKSYSHHEKTANDPRVVAAGKIVIEKTSRKRKADGPPLAIARSSGRKVARDDTRSVNHAAEQMRPAGEKIQPHEMSKLDYKRKSDVPPLAIARSSGSEVARDDTRSVTHAQWQVGCSRRYTLG